MVADTAVQHWALPYGGDVPTLCSDTIRKPSPKIQKDNIISITNVLIIVFDLLPFQEFAKLVLEGDISLVLFLHNDSGMVLPHIFYHDLCGT